MPAFRHAAIAALLTAASAAAPAQTVLKLPLPASRVITAKDAPRASVEQLAPSTADGRMARFELDSDGSIAPANAALLLAHVPAASDVMFEIPFKVAVPGLERIEVDCALVGFGLNLGLMPSGPGTVLGRTWHAASLPGPAAGTLRLGIARADKVAPDDGVAAAAGALAQRVTGGGQDSAGPSRLAALCELTASGTWQGTAWRSVTDSTLALGSMERSKSVMLLDTGKGLRWVSQPFVTTPSTIVAAVPPGLLP